MSPDHDYRNHDQIINELFYRGQIPAPKVSHLSPDTVIRCLQSLVNFIPVTTSAKQNSYILNIILLSLLLHKCQASLFGSFTRVSKHSGNTLPSVEVKDADVFIRAAGGYILT